MGDSTMAYCEHCGQDTRIADSCKGFQIRVGGTWFRRIPYGMGDDAWGEVFERCPDCGVRVGGLHHPGCEFEECPRCHGRYVDCPCGPDPDCVTFAARNVIKSLKMP